MTTKKKFPNFIDLFPYDDCKKAYDAFTTFDCGLSPVCLSAPSQIYKGVKCITDKKSSSIRFSLKTLRLEYAIQVWIKTFLISQSEPGPLLYYWWLGYNDNETSFRDLKYTQFDCSHTPEERVELFWKLLEDVANSGSITVSEGYSFNSIISKGGYFNHPNISVDVVLDAMNTEDGEQRITDIFKYKYNRTPRTFKWDDIKDLFTQLTLKQLSLYDLSKLHKSSNSDKQLFKACRDLDIDTVKKAIGLGANVNALDAKGASPLQCTIEFFEDKNLSFSIYENKYTESEITRMKHDNYEKCLTIVDLLIDTGADVDLFGAEGIQPLQCAYEAHSIQLVRHLLERGANPNYNSYRWPNMKYDADEFCQSSILKDISECPLEFYDDINERIEKLLREYGGRIYAWDLDVSRRRHIGRYYISFDATGGESLFFDNAGIGIGDDKSITIENENGVKSEVTLSKIDCLREWKDEYEQNIDNPHYDWNAWNKRGIAFAKKIAKMLPEYVALYYPFGDNIEIKYDEFDGQPYLEHLREERLMTPL